LEEGGGGEMRIELTGLKQSYRNSVVQMIVLTTGHPPIL
jgi:hypothetical protein